MKDIHLKSISLRGFRSFKDPAVIALSAPAGLKLVTGENRAEPRLGANGAGKSTVWDAVCFALYGTSIKGLRAADLVTRGEKETTVSLRLAVNGEEIHVVRSGPPLRLYINGKPMEQAALDHLLGLSKPRFLNSVLFGQAQPLFIDLSIPDRGELLDDVLALGMWMEAANLATTKASSTTQHLTETRLEVSNFEGRVAAFTDLSSVEAQELQWEGERGTRLEAVITQYEEQETERAGLEQRVEKLPAPQNVRELMAVCDRLQTAFMDKHRQVTEVETALGFVNETIDFFGENSVCPSCKQEIPPELAEQHLKVEEARARRLKDQVKTFTDEREGLRQNQVTANAAWQAANSQNAVIDRDRAGLISQIRGLNRTMEVLEQQAQRIAEEGNPFTQTKKEMVAQREGLEKTLTAKREEVKQIQTTLGQFEYWKRGFRAMRLFAMKRVLTQLEVETMNAAHSLGLIGWKIKFVTETETRSGTARSGVQITIEGPESAYSWQTLSGGEGQRVRLCIALGLAGLIQRWSGVRYDWEVFDEPSAWLSAEGIEDLLVCLQQRAEAYGRSLYVCDHRALAYAGFSEVLNVVKTPAGSTVEWLSGGPGV